MVITNATRYSFTKPRCKLVLILKPLIKETADKIHYLNPKEAQTGPAVRFDQKTIKAHEDFLTNKTSQTI